MSKVEGWRARQDSNLRPSAPEARGTTTSGARWAHFTRTDLNNAQDPPVPRRRIATHCHIRTHWRIYFHEGPGKTKQIILSVKAGKLHATYVRDLRGVVEREKSEIGVLISLEEPTAPMRKEAASAGFYASPWGKHPRIQILTVEDLLTGKTINRPPAQASVSVLPYLIL
jgi:hypothetical protein